MCRSIKTLYNFEPPVTEDEIRAAALQYVRKLSGYARPSKTNEAVFNAAVEEVAEASRRLLAGLDGGCWPGWRRAHRRAIVRSRRRRPGRGRPSAIATRRQARVRRRVPFGENFALNCKLVILDGLRLPRIADGPDRSKVRANPGQSCYGGPMTEEEQRPHD